MANRVRNVWLRAPVGEELALQRPLAPERLRIVAQGEFEDPPSGAVKAAKPPESQLLLPI
ncbi:MAG TPA: hypothetical protein VFC56_12535 [Stellaceae bacterium]|nr:hypothetical protein [Stellaceae bacterium]